MDWSWECRSVQGFPINRVLGNQRKATGWRCSKMLTHFTMACTENVSVPELNLTCLRELKTIGGTTPHLLRATGILSLPESCCSRFPSATSSLAHPVPLSLTFLSFATLAIFSALSCFFLTLLT